MFICASLTIWLANRGVGDDSAVVRQGNEGASVGSEWRWRGRRRAWLGSVLLLAAPVLLAPGVASAASTPVSGGGSSLAAPEMLQWAADESAPPAALTVNFGTSDAGVGKDSYASGTLQFGATEMPYTAEDGSFEAEAESQHPFVYVPVSAGGLAFMYNIVINGQRWTGLNLTPDEVCQIFTGQVQTWNQLASTPGDAVLAGVTQPIEPIIRSDATGENYVLSQYCLAVDPADWSTFEGYVDAHAQAEAGLGWAGDVGLSAGQPIEYWPPQLSGSVTGIPANGASISVNDITSPSHQFSIGYVASAYAVTAAFPMASVENAAGVFVQPNANSVQHALGGATLNNLGTFDLSYSGSDPQAYFPSTYSYIIAPVTADPPSSAGSDATLAQFLCYAVGTGQSDAEVLRYAPLSQMVTTVSVNAIEQIPGAPPASSCGTGGPTSPPVQLPEFPAPALALIAPVGVMSALVWRRRHNIGAPRWSRASSH